MRSELDLTPHWKELCMTVLSVVQGEAKLALSYMDKKEKLVANTKQLP